jgi:hypothetical protein
MGCITLNLANQSGHRRRFNQVIDQGACQNLSQDPLIDGLDHDSGSLTRSNAADIDFIRSALMENPDKDHLLGHHFQRYYA